MKMMLLLLACSAALISNMDAMTIIHRRKEIVFKCITVLENLEHFNATLPEELKHSFVEDLENLTRGPHKCKREFFCKVEAILAMHTDFEPVKPVVTALTVLNSDIKDTCDKVKNRETTDDEIEFQKLLKLLKMCLQYKISQKNSLIL